MPQVVIQPSYGNATARAHWADTLNREVPFAHAPYAAALSIDQMRTLIELHASGAARFWGAQVVHDTRMAGLQRGDVVLFTGGKLVRAVGEVGVSFRNGGFADLLWHPDPDKGSWHNVYSLLAFQPTEIPYDEIWQLPGFNTGGHRFLREALGQLLDYAPHAEPPVTSLAVLVPTQPSPGGLQLLDRYGVDCIWRREDGSFERRFAPADRRAHLQSAWSRHPSAAGAPATSGSH